MRAARSSSSPVPRSPRGCAAAGGTSRQDKAPHGGRQGRRRAVPVTVATVERRDVPGAPARQRHGGGAAVGRHPRADHQHRARGAHPRGPDGGQGRPPRVPRLARRGGQPEEGRGAGGEGPRRPRQRQRTLERQRQLFEQKFISQSALDAAREPGRDRSRDSSPWTWRPSRRRRSRSATRASTRASPAAPARSACGPAASCSPTGRVLVTVTQIDPIQVAFTLPEKEFPGHAARARRQARWRSRPREDGARPSPGG